MLLYNADILDILDQATIIRNRGYFDFGSPYGIAVPLCNTHGAYDMDDFRTGKEIMKDELYSQKEKY
jgi:hypothetical protein